MEEEASAEREDVLRVKTWPDRVVVDLVEDPFGTDYVALTSEGAMITLSAERVRLSWVALRQLCAVIALADRTFNRGDKEE